MCNSGTNERRPVGSRRRFVAALHVTMVGLGVVAIASSSARNTVEREDFGRMFHLPAFAPPNPKVQAALAELGKRGGLMDANDNLAAGPIALIVDPALSVNNPDSAQHTAGVTFMGQFIDHDMTFDTTSRLGQPTNPRTAPNARHPVFDLDSVYGDGPAGSPLLYEPSDRAKLRVESGGRFEDLPRDLAGRAIIADPRNDENLILAGLHCAFLLFHNRADRSRAKRPPDVARRRGVRRSASTHHVALPVGDPPRASAALRWFVDGERRARERPAILLAEKRSRLHPGRVSDRLPVRPQHGATVLSRELYRQ